MGKDNQPKARQAAKLARKKAHRASYERVLIVCEGSKTEPLYLNEIRSLHRLQTANVQVQHSQFGTTPIQVVEYAEQLFTTGDAQKAIWPRAFERVYAVFDRDDHLSYHNALAKANSLNKKLKNDLGQPVLFSAIPSVPCFELWLLLHFTDVLAPLHRTEVYERLRDYLPDYDKGAPGQFEATKVHLELASQRAQNLVATNAPEDGNEPYTNMHTLVNLLINLKS